MKNIFIFLLFLVSTLAETKGQQVYFNKSYNYYTYVEVARGVIPRDSSYAVLSIGANGGSQYNTEFDFIDSVGNIQWKKTYGKPNYRYYIGWNGSFVKTSDGGYAVGGSTLDAAGKNRGLLMKFNIAGDTLWTRQYENDSTVIFYHCAQTFDHGFILLGYSDINEYWGDFFLVKTDSLGNEQWRRTYGTNSVEYGSSVTQTTDGGYLMGGLVQFSNGNVDMRVVKADAAGNQQWTRTYGSQYPEGNAIVTSLSDGNYAFCGTYTDYDFASSPRGQPYIVKLDPNGNIIWSKTYGPISASHILTRIIEVENGDLVSCGFRSDTITHGIILKVTAQGDSIWYRDYEKTLSTDYNNLYDIKATSDNGYIAVGSNFSFGNDQDLWLLKVDSLGCTYPGCDPTAAVEEITPGTYSLRNYPNPFDDRTVIEATVPANAANAELLVYDVMGKVIKRIPLHEGMNNINVAGNELEAGIYFYTLLVNNERLATNKMVYLKK